MSIQPIDNNRTRGVQVRVFRGGRVALTRFLAYKKHGGKEKTLKLARATEKEMEKLAGPTYPSRRGGYPADKPNANSSSGIPGIRVFVLDRRGKNPVMQFSTTWRFGPKGQRTIGTLQRSSAEHGILSALGQILAARETGCGNTMPTSRKAWEIIKNHLVINKKDSNEHY